MTETLLPAEPAPVSRRIELTERGFRQDAQAAMKGDVMRALVELITNSDDALRHVGHTGNIRIWAEHARSGGHNRIIVQDDGPGMTHEQMEEGLLKRGNRTSDSQARGFWGFGAKDVSAFGYTDFQAITNDEQYSRMVIHKTGSVDDWGSVAANPIARAELSMAKTGMRVTLHVQRPIAVPKHKTLIDRLRRHVQLRDILGRQTVTLSDLSNVERTPTVLRYQPPDWIEQKLDERFTVPAYPNAEAHLVIYRCESRLPDERTPWRDSGILIAGRNAVHQATYFGLDNRSGALWFTGRLECPAIDDLQDEFDRREERADTPQRSNPFPLLTRTRDGLEPTHPFTLALKREVESRLGPLVDEAERDESRQTEVESEDTRRRLNDCAKAMEEEFRRVAEERELEVDTTSQDVTVIGKAVALEVLPSALRLDPGGDERRLTIRAWPEAWTDDEPLPDPPMATVQCDSDAVVVSPEDVLLTSDPRNPARMRGVVAVASSTDDEDSYTATVTLGTRAFTVIINVAEEEEPEPPVPPERLEFKPEQQTILKGRRRRLRLRAPAELVDGRDPAVSIRGTPGVGAPPEVGLEPVETEAGARWYEARVAVEGIAAGSWRIRAEFADQLAACRVVVKDTEAARFAFRLRKEAPKYAGEGRSRWTTVDKVNVCLILTGHHSLARFFANRSRKGEIDQSEEVRLLLAEIIADAMTTFSLLHSSDGSVPSANAFGYFSTERNKLMDRYLRVAQRYVARQAIPEEVS
jgi:hypothetical protein